MKNLIHSALVLAATLLAVEAKAEKIERFCFGGLGSDSTYSFEIEVERGVFATVKNAQGARIQGLGRQNFKKVGEFQYNRTPVNVFQPEAGTGTFSLLISQALIAGRQQARIYVRASAMDNFGEFNFDCEPRQAR